jgi:hypothetical protein
MLRDPNFNLYDLYEYNKDKGLYFSTKHITNPITGSNMEAVCGYTDLSHPFWKEKMTSEKGPVRLFCEARHAEGIYFGFPMDDALDMSPTDFNNGGNCDFDLNTGMWYSWDETHEQYGREDINSSEPLSSGKPPARFNHLARGYGLADNVTQILKHYVRVVTHSEYDVVLHLRHHSKDDLGGMRWHKQGQYLGRHKKKHEYISDEEGIDSMLQFHFYVLK